MSVDVIPLSEIARRLDISEKTAKSWARRHGLPLFEIVPGRWFASWTSIERWALDRMTR